MSRDDGGSSRDEGRRGPPAGGLVEVYAARARDRLNLDEAMRLLRESGLTPFMMDHPSPEALYVTKGIYRVRIGVSEDEAPEAAKVIGDWCQRTAPAVEEHERRMLKDLLVSMPAAPAVFGLYWLCRRDWSEIGWRGFLSLAAWLLTFVIVANMGKRSR